MRKLGISIYPEKSTMNEMKNYIESAARVGVSRMFTCLLSMDERKKMIQ